MAVWTRVGAGNESLPPREGCNCYISMPERREMYQMNQFGASVATFPAAEYPANPDWCR